MEKRLTGLLFLLVLVSVPLIMLNEGAYKPLRTAIRARSNQLPKVEWVMSSRFPGLETFRRLQVSLNYMGGNKEQNGVFISKDALMLDVQPKDLDAGNQNMLSIVDFADDFQRASYVMLTPTACAVQQSKVPYTDIAPLYDQKKLIDDTYRRVSGHVTAINVYPTLFKHQDEYIYYRTDNSLTGLGGYYAYSVAAGKMGWKPRGIDEFDVDHLDNRYYGDLYQLSPFREIQPDRVSAYVFSKFIRNFTVTHYDRDGAKRYYTLYPEYKKDLGNTMDVLLGGMSPIIDISISSRTALLNRHLLVFSDRSVQSFLPFLLTHYGRVTVVDTTQVTPEMLAKFDASDYTQVLFAYSVDTFVTSDQLSVLSSIPIPNHK